MSSQHRPAHPDTLPAPHRGFLDRCLPLLSADKRIAEVWVGGSYLTDRMDEFSDLDLLVVVDAASFASGRHAIAEGLGNLLSAFSAEHIGIPDLLICLYREPLPGALLHVDMRFLAQGAGRGALPTYGLLWSRDSAAAPEAALPAPAAVDVDWIEARFWTWVHYGAGKIGRGELLEALDFLGFLRSAVLGPLALELHGAPPFGVRRVEAFLPPPLMAMLAATTAAYDSADCLRALRQAIALYRQLRTAHAGAAFGNAAAESAALDYLDRVSDSMGLNAIARLITSRYNCE